MWTLVKNELLGAQLLELNSDGRLASGMSIDFHPVDKKIYLCGTEEGELFKVRFKEKCKCEKFTDFQCTTSYKSKYLSRFKAHDSAIMSIKWNIFHPDVYATASQDWTLKIWSQKRPQIPLFNFELGAPVNDIDWAPFSSTVICGVTEGDNSRYENFSSEFNL